MYGICGFTGSTKNNNKTINRMSSAISHSKTSICTSFESEQIAMGVCSLAQESTQPIYNENKTLVLTFSGRIYNASELSKELAEAGHVFSAETDGEVILHAFEEWGEDVLPRLRGAFAFAIYNKEDKSLFLARDCFGIKPLYYALINNELAYASEIKSILKHPDFEKKLNLNALNNYLSFQYATPPETFFEGVYCLLPGHFMWYKNSDIMTERYFEPRFTPDENLSEQDAVNMIEAAFDSSVNAHIGTDNTVGCLSGTGINSAYLSSYIAKEKTFAVSFEAEDNNDELISKSSEHVTKHTSCDEFMEAVPSVLRLLDQPVADPSCITMYLKAQLASAEVKAVLSSEGADELFGGYKVYRSPMEQKLYHKLVPFPLRKALRSLARKMPDNKMRSYLIRSCDPLEEAFIGKSYLYNYEEKRELLKDASLATPPQDVTKGYYRRARKFDDVAKMQYIDINLWLAGNELLKAERMCTANSVELRLPFLDKEVWRVAARIPQKLRVNRTSTKYTFRQAALRHLPQEGADSAPVSSRAPVNEWIKSEKYYNIIKQEFKSPTAQKFFNIDVLLNWLDDHFEGLADTSRSIWTVYVFLVWYKEYFEEVTATEIKEDAIAEIESIAEEESCEVAQSTLGIPNPERLDELFGMAFDDEDGAGIDESLLADAQKTNASTTEE